MNIKRLMIGLILLCLIPFISSCGLFTKTETITKTKYVYLTPPDTWIKEREIPALKGKENEDLFMWSLDMKEVIEKHNKDKAIIKLWKKGIPKDKINIEEEEK